MVLIFVAFVLLRFVASQNLSSSDPDPIVYEKITTSKTINYVLTPPNSASTMICSFVNPNETGFAGASFSVNSLTLTLSSFAVGRTRSFICSITNQPTVSQTKYLTVLPQITAMVCGTPSTVKSLNNGASLSVTIKFSSALTSDATINCTSNSSPNVISSNTASNGTSNLTVSISYPANSLSGITNDTMTCRFSLPQNPDLDFNFNVSFLEPVISLSPSTIVTSSPIIQLSLVSNFILTEILSFTCTIQRTIASCPATADASINWTLTSNAITFNQLNAVNTVLLTMTKTSSINNTVTELYYIICCNNDTNVATANVTISSGVSNFNANATGTETSYGDLSYVRLSNCPCDLTVGSCDDNCCCDSFCKCNASTTRFIGPYGGYFNDSLPRSCNYQDDLTKKPFKSVLCVMNESPNILGDYYPMQPIINSTSSFTSVLSNSIRTNIFKIKITDLSSGSQTSSSYISASINAFNTPIITTRNLYLPRQTLNSLSCDLQNPILFLQPYQSSCSYTVTSSNCESTTDPRLSSYFYLISSTVNQTKCTDKVFITAVQGNIPIFTFYQCNGATDCSFDNGYNLPPTPTLSNSICKNIVEKVVYTIYYNSTSISYISANVSLNDISVGGTLNQIFQVLFVQSSATQESSAVQSFSALQASTVSSSSTSSGLYGYDDGKPVRTTNDPTNSTITSTIKSLPISVSGVCGGLGNDIVFPRNSLTQCNFDISNLTSCDQKRNEIRSYIEKLFPTNYVAIYGSPSSSGDYIFVNTTTPNITNGNISSNANVPANQMQGYCLNIVTGLTVTIFYTRQGKARNQYIHNIARVTKRYEVSNISDFTTFPSTSSQTRYITLISYVEFQLVSTNITGNKSTDDVGQVVCNYDVCLNELFYPWMYNYEGKQGFYEEAFGIFLLGLAVFFFAFFYC